MKYTKPFYLVVALALVINFWAQPAAAQQVTLDGGTATIDEGALGGARRVLINVISRRLGTNVDRDARIATVSWAINAVRFADGVGSPPYSTESIGTLYRQQLDSAIFELPNARYLNPSSLTKDVEVVIRYVYVTHDNTSEARNFVITITADDDPPVLAANLRGGQIELQATPGRGLTIEAALIGDDSPSTNSLGVAVPFRYVWHQIQSKPAGYVVGLRKAEDAIRDFGETNGVPNDPAGPSIYATFPRSATPYQVVLEVLVYNDAYEETSERRARPGSATYLINVGHTVPRTDAGEAPSGVMEGETFTLNGSGAVRIGETLTHAWTVTSAGATPTITIADLGGDPNTATPTFTAPQHQGSYDLNFTLTVVSHPSQIIGTDTVTVRIIAPNDAPVITVPDEDSSALVASIGMPYALDASAFTTDDGAAAIGYSWQVISTTGPAPNMIDISASVNMPTLRFTPPTSIEDYDITLMLTVTDTVLPPLSSSAMLVVKALRNSPPAVSASVGSSTTAAGTPVSGGDEVTLSATVDDPDDKDIATVVWTVSRSNAAPPITIDELSLTYLSATRARITAPSRGATYSLLMRATATDSLGATASAQTGVLRVINTNTPPIATAAGPRGTLPAGAPFRLIGTATDDGGAANLTYAWTVTSSGAEPAVILANLGGNPSSATPIFTAPARSSAYTLEFTLVVTDAAGASAPQRAVRVRVSGVAVLVAPGPPQTQIFSASSASPPVIDEDAIGRAVTLSATAADTSGERIAYAWVLTEVRGGGYHEEAFRATDTREDRAFRAGTNPGRTHIIGFNTEQTSTTQDDLPTFVDSGTPSTITFELPPANVLKFIRAASLIFTVYTMSETEVMAARTSGRGMPTVGDLRDVSQQNVEILVTANNDPPVFVAGVTATVSNNAVTEEELQVESLDAGSARVITLGVGGIDAGLPLATDEDNPSELRYYWSIRNSQDLPCTDEAQHAPVRLVNFGKFGRNNGNANASFTFSPGLELNLKANCAIELVLTASAGIQYSNSDGTADGVMFGRSIDTLAARIEIEADDDAPVITSLTASATNLQEPDGAAGGGGGLVQYIATFTALVVDEDITVARSVDNLDYAWSITAGATLGTLEGADGSSPSFRVADNLATGGTATVSLTITDTADQTATETVDLTINADNDPLRFDPVAPGPAPAPLGPIIDPHTSISPSIITEDATRRAIRLSVNGGDRDSGTNNYLWAVTRADGGGRSAMTTGDEAATTPEEAAALRAANPLTALGIFTSNNDATPEATFILAGSDALRLTSDYVIQFSVTITNDDPANSGQSLVAGATLTVTPTLTMPVARLSATGTNAAGAAVDALTTAIAAGSTVMLDASGSTAEAPTYSWSLVDNRPREPLGLDLDGSSVDPSSLTARIAITQASAFLPTAAFVAPASLEDYSLTVELEVFTTLHDAGSRPGAEPEYLSATTRVTINVSGGMGNAPTITGTVSVNSNAGLLVGAAYTLDAAPIVSDPDNDVVSYVWSLGAAPRDQIDGITEAVLGLSEQDTSTSTFTFTAPNLGLSTPYTIFFDLTVTDSGGNEVSSVTTSSVAFNPPPTRGSPPVIGDLFSLSRPPDAGIIEGQHVTLDATSLVSDPDGDIVSYVWSLRPGGQTAGITEAVLVLASQDTSTPTLTFVTPDLPFVAAYDIVFVLTVTDSRGNVTTSDSNLALAINPNTVNNNLPTVSAVQVPASDGVAPFTPFTLDATPLVTDADSDVFAYVWSVNEAQTSAFPGFTLDLSHQDITTPMATVVFPPRAGNLAYEVQFTLTVIDSKGNAASVDTNVVAVNPTPNNQPTVSSSANLLATNPRPGERATIDARTIATDVDNDIVSYVWSLAPGSQPAGISKGVLDLASQDTSTPLLTLVPPYLPDFRNGYDVSLLLRVTDSLGNVATNNVASVVSVAPALNNNPPSITALVVLRANAPAAFTSFSLDATPLVTDADNDVVAYVWSLNAAQTGGFQGLSLDLSHQDIATPMATVVFPMRPGNLAYEVQFTLTVTDSLGNTASDAANVVAVDPVPNTSPMLSASGVHRAIAEGITEGDTVTLDGSILVTDADNDIVAYVWSLAADQQNLGFAGQTLDLSHQDTSNPMLIFVAPYLAGDANFTIFFALTVTDSLGNTASTTSASRSSVAINANPIPPFIPSLITGIRATHEVLSLAGFTETQISAQIENLPAGVTPIYAWTLEETQKFDPSQTAPFGTLTGEDTATPTFTLNPELTAVGPAPTIPPFVTGTSNHVGHVAIRLTLTIGADTYTLQSHRIRGVCRDTSNMVIACPDTPDYLRLEIKRPVIVVTPTDGEGNGGELTPIVGALAGLGVDVTQPPSQQLISSGAAAAGFPLVMDEDDMTEPALVLLDVGATINSLTHPDDTSISDTRLRYNWEITGISGGGTTATTDAAEVAYITETLEASEQDLTSSAALLNIFPASKLRLTAGLTINLRLTITIAGSDFEGLIVDTLRGGIGDVSYGGGMKVVITADNDPPTAVVRTIPEPTGRSVLVNAGQTLTLDGSASTDPEAGITGYVWYLRVRPEVITPGGGASSPFLDQIQPRVTNSFYGQAFSFGVGTEQFVYLELEQDTSTPTLDIVVPRGASSYDMEAFLVVVDNGMTSINLRAHLPVHAPTPPNPFTPNPPNPVVNPDLLRERLAALARSAASAKVSVNVFQNGSPQASAQVSPGSCVQEGESATLIGSNSVDRSGNIVSYVWRQVDSNPDEITIDLSGADTTRPDFSFVTPNRSLSYNLYFELTVTDDGGSDIGASPLSDTSNVQEVCVLADQDPTVITLINAENRLLREGESTRLTAELSGDTDVNYRWRVTSGGELGSLADATAAMPTFTAATDLTQGGTVYIVLSLAPDISFGQANIRPPANKTMQLEVVTSTPGFAPPVIDVPHTVFTRTDTAFEVSAFATDPDTDDDDLTYMWDTTGFTNPTAADTATIILTAPSAAGDYPLGLVVSDGANEARVVVNVEVAASTGSFMTITSLTATPEAASAAAEVALAVTINSNISIGNSQWTLVASPGAVPPIAEEDLNIVKLSQSEFIDRARIPVLPSRATNYRLVIRYRVTGSDGALTASDLVTIDVTADRNPVTAILEFMPGASTTGGTGGIGGSVMELTEFVLSGMKSRLSARGVSSEGGTNGIAHSWSLVSSTSVPAITMAELNPAADRVLNLNTPFVTVFGPTASFVAPDRGADYELVLSMTAIDTRVIDLDGFSPADTAQIRVQVRAPNEAPTAVVILGPVTPAARDANGRLIDGGRSTQRTTFTDGEEFTLTAHASDDGGTEGISYSWRLARAPPGSTAPITDISQLTATGLSTATPTFTAPPNLTRNITLTFYTTATDGAGLTTESLPFIVTVIAQFALDTGGDAVVSIDFPNMLQATLRDGDAADARQTPPAGVDFLWTVQSVSAIAGSQVTLSQIPTLATVTAAITGSDTQSPTLTPPACTGTGECVYLIVIRVTATTKDGFVASSEISLTALHNELPMVTTASASPATVAEGAEVTLNGIATDPDVDGSVVSYAWTVASSTANPPITITELDLAQANTATAAATITLPERTASYTFVMRLTATDNSGGSAPRDTTTITVTADNDAPTASAGNAPAGAVMELMTFTLAGSGADDGGVANLSYAWTVTSAATPRITITDLMGNETSAAPTFTAPDRAADYTLNFTLMVTDAGGIADTGTVSVPVTADDDPPTASAGAAPSGVDETEDFTLVGSGTDDGAAALTYAWMVASTVTPVIAIDDLGGDSTSAMPTFTAPERGGDYRLNFTLTVSGGGSTATDTVAVSVTAPNDAPVIVHPMANPIALVASVGLAYSLDATDFTTDDGGSSAINYLWQVTDVTPQSGTLTPGSAPTVAAISTAIGASMSTAVLAFTPPANNDVDYTITVLLTASDILTLSDTASIMISVIHNIRPTVSFTTASPTVAAEATTVTLGGAAVDTVGGTITSYAWTVQDTNAVPTFSTADVSLSHVDTTTATATIIMPDRAADYTLVMRLTATDNDDAIDIGDTEVIMVTADNDPPVVEAGDAPTSAVMERATFTLNGSAKDDGGATLTYAWTLATSTVTPAITLANLMGDAASATPTFTAPDRATDYRLDFTLTVTGGGNSGTDTVTVLVTAANDSPVITAPAPNAAALVASVGQPYSLAASAFTSDDGDPAAISYVWQVTAVVPTPPATSAPSVATIRTAISASMNNASLTFTPPTNSNVDYTVSVRLTVSDSQTPPATELIIIRATHNALPTVTAATATPTVANEGATIALRGAATDSDGRVVRYVWTLQDTNAMPTITTADLGLRHINTATANATLILPGRTATYTLVMRLTATDNQDGEGFGKTMTITATAVNNAPTATAGNAPSGVTEAVPFTLAGSGTDDGGVANLTYAWTVTSTVATPPVILANLGGDPTSAMPTFTPPERPANYVLSFTLTVTDAAGGTAAASVVVPVTANNDPPGAPTITNQPTSLDENDNDGTFMLTPTATDDGVLADLTYSWAVGAASEVTIAELNPRNTAGGATTFSLPNRKTNYRVVVVLASVSDGVNRPVTGTDAFNIEVTADDDDPQLTLSADTTIITGGETATLRVVPDDPEGDPPGDFTYCWQQAGATLGLLPSSSAAPTVSFIAPTLLSAAVAVDIQITVRIAAATNCGTTLSDSEGITRVLVTPAGDLALDTTAETVLGSLVAEVEYVNTAPMGQERDQEAVLVLSGLPRLAAGVAIAAANYRLALRYSEPNGVNLAQSALPIGVSLSAEQVATTIRLQIRDANNPNFEMTVTQLPAATNVCMLPSAALLQLFGGVVADLAIYRFTNGMWVDLPSSTPQTRTVSGVSGEYVCAEVVMLGDFVLAGSRVTNASLANRAREWLMRMGRSVADQSIAVVHERSKLLSSATLSNYISAGSHKLSQATAGTYSRPNTAPYQQLLTAHEDGALGSRTQSLTDLRRMAHDINFNLSGADAKGGTGAGLSLWGQVNHNRLKASPSDLTINGNVTSFQMGADYKFRQRALVGVAATLSMGEADLAAAERGQRTTAKAETMLLTAIPYFYMNLTDNFSVWMLTGFGSGTTEYTQFVADGDDAVINPDVEFSMVALGLKMERRVGAASSMSIKGDVMTLTTKIDQVAPDVADGMPTNIAEANISRLRLQAGISTVWEYGISTLLDLGYRYDSGDAEVGTGFDVGAEWGVKFGRLDLNVKGRYMFDHTNDSYEDLGFSISAALNPRDTGSGTAKGASFKLSTAVGTDVNIDTERIWRSQNQEFLGTITTARAEPRMLMDLSYRLDAGASQLEPFAGLTTRISDNAILDARVGARLLLLPVRYAGRPLRLEMYIGTDTRSFGYGRTGVGISLGTRF